MDKAEDSISSKEWHEQVTSLLPQNFDALVWLLNLWSYYKSFKEGIRQGCLHSPIL